MAAEGGTPLPVPDELAEALASVVLDATARSEYDRLVGPCYSGAGAMRVLGITVEQVLADLRARGTVLAARTSNDMWVYPAFQFDVEAHAVLHALVPVLAELRGAPRWGAALWLVSAHEDLGGRSPLEAAAASAEDRERVCQLAAQYAQASGA